MLPQWWQRKNTLFYLLVCIRYHLLCSKSAATINWTSFFLFSQRCYFTIYNLPCSSLGTHRMALLKLVLSLQIFSTDYRQLTKGKGTFLFPRIVFNPHKMTSPIFMPGYSVIFLLCIKHGKAVPINVLMLCYDFLKVWQRRGESSDWVRYYNVQCGISFSLEICNFFFFFQHA